MELTRRQTLRALGAVGLAGGLGAVLPGCGSPFAGLRLRIAAGSTGGDYLPLGNALADVWQERLRLDARPEVADTRGSRENVAALRSSTTDVAISQLDVAADNWEQGAIRALAAVYADVVQVVVPASSPVRRLADLRGLRVSVGTVGSGVTYVADRVLVAAGMSERDLRPARLGVTHSARALHDGRLEAFFWVGALPSRTLGELAGAFPIRVLDLGEVLEPLRAVYPVYTSVTVPDDTYGIPERVTTLQVRNVLLVAEFMDDDLAAALTDAVFAEPEQLTTGTQAARTIDARSAIFTQPVPLHDGALRWFQDDATV